MATPSSTLAAEIKGSEKLYVDAAIEGFSKRFRAEYLRLRGYAHEAGTLEIMLEVQVECGFDPTNRFVNVSSRPQFSPPVGETKTKLR